MMAIPHDATNVIALIALWLFFDKRYRIAILAASFILFLEQLVYSLKIVERIVDLEAQFRDDAKLIAHLVAKGSADVARVLVDVADDFRAFVRREDAEEDLGCA